MATGLGLMERGNLAEIHLVYNRFVKNVRTHYIGSFKTRMNLSSPEFFRRSFQIVLSRYNPRILDVIGDHLDELGDRPFSLKLSRDRCFVKPAKQDKILLSTRDWIFYFVRSTLFFLRISHFIAQAFLKKLLDQRMLSSEQIIYVKGMNATGFIGKENYFEKLVSYLDDSNLRLFHDKNLTYLVAFTEDGEFRNYRFSKKPLEILLAHSKLSQRDLIRIFLSTWKCYFDYLISLKKNINVFLGEDLSSFALFSFLNEKKILKGTVCTNSEWYTQEIWTNLDKGRYFKNHLLWCSTNSVGFNFKSGPKYIEAPWASIIAVDYHWVWDQAQEDWVSENLPFEKIITVGPIIFRNPTNQSIEKKNRVILFDVNPVLRGEMDRVISKYYIDYYCSENMIKFVKDAVEALEKVDPSARVAIKHKRLSSNIFDPDYISFISQLESDGRIDVLDPHCNIWDELKSSKLSLSVPFTSTAKVALSAKVPSFYYDPTDSIDFDEYKGYCKGIKTVPSREDLVRSLGEHWLV